MELHIGGDVSKGYCDFRIFQKGFTKLGRLDDTPEGHEKLHNYIASHRNLSRIVVGLESTGGYELNWIMGLQRFRDRHGFANLKVCLVNPLQVKKFREADRLHESISDPSSATVIAKFLNEKDDSLREADYSFFEEKRFERYLHARVKELAALKVEFKGVLQYTHPYLVQRTRGAIPDYLLKVIEAYPSQERLANANIEDLMKINHVNSSRASWLKKNAARGIGAFSGEKSWAILQGMVEEISRRQETVEKLKRQLTEPFRDDPVVSLYQSIKGFGLYTAVLLRLIYGDCSRFSTANKVVAYAGLDCKNEQSGDGEKKPHISRRGNSRIRALLYIAALSAVRQEGPFRDLFLRLKNEGKPGKLAIVAVMAKMLRVAYAIQVSQKPYDLQKAKPSNGCPVVIARKPNPGGSAEAPTSVREAKRRAKLKTAARISHEVEPQKIRI